MKSAQSGAATKEDPVASKEELSTSKPKKTRRSPLTKTKRGFASMDPAFVRELAKRGGLASQASGQGHRFTAEEARRAGSKGGIATQKRFRQRKLEVVKDEAPVTPIAEEGSRGE